MSASIFERALGGDFERLSPGLRRYFGASEAISASGVFVEAGSRQRWLLPLWAILERFGMLFAEYGRDVPFTITITPISDATVQTVRRIGFAGGHDKVMADRTSLIAGRLIDVHARGRLLVEMITRVGPDGSLGLRSRRARLRLGRISLPVPSPRVEVEQSVTADGVYSIRVAVSMPLLGEVFGYRGTFTLD